MYARLNYPAKALHISNNTKYLAVGYTNGKVDILDPKTLNNICSFKESD